LNVLNPDMFIDTKTFQNSVDGNKESGSERRINNDGFPFFVIDVADQGPIEKRVGEGG